MNGACLDMTSMLMSLMEVASALVHLHRLGIVHCDIKVGWHIPDAMMQVHL